MPSHRPVPKEGKSKNPKQSKPRAIKQVAPENFKSEQFVKESSDEGSDEDSSNSGELASKKQLAAISEANIKVKPAVIDTISSSGSGSGSGSESESADSEGSDESTEADDSDDEEDSGGENENESAKLSKNAKSQPKNSASISVVLEKPPPYEPPSGFALASIGAAPKSTEFLDKSALDGKHIWYITAPAAISISSIREVALEDLKSGKSVLSHNGNEYGFVEDATEDNMCTKILVPKSSGDGYHAGPKSIDKSLHLQQIVQLPVVHGANTTRIGDSKPRPTYLTKKPIRKQPRGLKMRFRPIGFGDGEAGEIGSSSSSVDGSDSENSVDEDAQASTFRRPQEVSDAASVSDHSSDVEMTDAQPLPPKAIIPPNHRNGTKDSAKAADKSLKRKHNGDSDMKGKKSSSSSSIDNNQLKKMKKKKKKVRDHNRSVSIETYQSNATTTSKVPLPLPQTLESNEPLGRSRALQPLKYPILPPQSTKANQSLSQNPIGSTPQQEVAGGKKKRKRETRMMNGSGEKKDFEVKADTTSKTVLQTPILPPKSVFSR